MKCLIVFDENIDFDALSRIRLGVGDVRVDIFPLVENAMLMERVMKKLNERGVFIISRISSAEAICRHVDNLRSRIGEWGFEAGNADVGGKTVKEWMLLPGLDVSAWWFGLLAERDTGRYDFFLKIAQAKAIEEILQQGVYDRMLTAVSSRVLRETLMNLADNIGVQATMLRTPSNQSIGRRIRDFFENGGFACAIVLGLAKFAKFMTLSALARCILGSRSRQLQNGRSILFVTYFPLVDKADAERGVFTNRYAGPLQDMLRKMGKNVCWLLMTLPLEGYSFCRSVALAKRLIAGGERMHLLEEYLLFRDGFTALGLWFRQLFVAKRLYRHILDKFLLAGPVGRECGPVVASLWNTSFYGLVGMGSILYALAYRRAFAELKNPTHCIYYAEMHAWERALNAGRRSVAPGVKTIGYQHAIAPKNFFNYFCDPRESVQKSMVTDLPLPHIFACCGDILREQFESCGYPNLRMVEAVRYLYLEKLLSSPVPRKAARPLLLVAGSIDYNENLSLLSMLYEAFPRADHFDIVCKGHPALPLKEIFRELGIDPVIAGYTVQEGDLSERLEGAWAVFVASSTVSIEALAFGCEVIVPIFPNTIMMNPVADFDGYCHLVTSAGDLVKAMEQIIQGGTIKTIDEKRDFVKRYWCVDKELPRWKALLTRVTDEGFTEAES